VSEGPEQTITPEPTAAEAASSADAAPAVDVVETSVAAEVQADEIQAGEVQADQDEAPETVADATVEPAEVQAAADPAPQAPEQAQPVHEAEPVAAEPVETVQVETVQVETVQVETIQVETVQVEAVQVEAVQVAAEPVEAAPAEAPINEAPADQTAADETPAEPTAPAEPAAPAAPPVEVTGPWGRVSVEGVVYVRTAEGEREIGSWAAGTPDEAIVYYERKFDGLKVEVELLEKRIRTTDMAARDADTAIVKLRESLADAHAMGDLAALSVRVDKLNQIAEQRRAQRKEARAKQLAQAAEQKERLVAESETLAESAEWKKAGDRLRALVDEWKGIARLDRKSDDELWSRFSAARSAFAKRRKAHFAQLDSERDTARSRKESLVEEAVSLSDSTDWASTAQRFRDLMQDWKRAGRAQRDVEDKLWERFKAAQDTFFTARNADLDQRDAGFRENAARKEELLIEAQKLLPVSDFKAARSALRGIQTRWEEVGPVPRDAKGRIEGALRDVERAVAEAEQAEWQRTNPEARARAEATVRQLETSIAKFEKEADRARTAGQQRKVDEAVAAIAARREWLAQAQAALDEFTR
jgi:Domain of Unknown Function (DUF349)